VVKEWLKHRGKNQSWISVEQTFPLRGPYDIVVKTHDNGQNDTEQIYHQKHNPSRIPVHSVDDYKPDQI
jgi:hypothetical protein